ncbi:unnamed protein product [Arctia plantaginis]|uniref:Uncharacterized protein n=1 Tax=Arctia plantaginis TaxID=874455 RepID=A0A8S0ZMS3_ARCPL|nr:unnamed protein product [Arctia plantaginis]
MAPPLSEDNITMLLNLRGNLKGRITRIENYVKQVKDKDLARYEYEQLQIRSTDLTTLFEKYNDTQDHIENLQKTGEDSDERSAIEDKYYGIKAMITSLVQENSANDTLRFKPKKPPVAMPRLNIRQFNGDFKN